MRDCNQSRRNINQRGTAKMPRRRFLGQAAAVTAFAIVPRHVLGGRGQTAPSDKITLAGIGTGGRGLGNMMRFQQFPEVQVVAVCDVNRQSGGYVSWGWSEGKDRRVVGREPTRRAIDEYYAKEKRPGKYQGCRGYNDFRELLAQEDVDAVMVATPDHTHAVITMAALRLGKHVYCEKPLTYTVHEARQVTKAARKAGVATQLGNQGQAAEEARVACEMIWDGAIGPVHEVYVSNPARFWPYPAWQGRPPGTPPVPDGLDWDLWLGPTPERPYHPAYCPWSWRNWWDFGTGQIGDLGCHRLSTVFKALKLGHPVTVEACSTKMDSEIYPLGIIARYEFPARDDMPPLKLTWYDGGLTGPRPRELEPGRYMSNVMYVGEKGKLMGHILIPDSKRKAYGRPPKKLRRSVGHHKEWIDACRGGRPAGSNFLDHGGLLTEVCLLANVALRAGEKVQWDGLNMKVTNNEAANQYLHRTYREGWTL